MICEILLSLKDTEGNASQWFVALKYECHFAWCSSTWNLCTFFESKETERVLKRLLFSTTCSWYSSHQQTIKRLQHTIEPPYQQKKSSSDYMVSSSFVEYKFSWILCGSYSRKWMFIGVQHMLAYWINW